ncbi:MAG: preprotein translocase subunit SecA [Oscillospiraceae bacterium]|nr:preprotein translocase subunit SecA [Oscillospiraceae bacterium]
MIGSAEITKIKDLAKSGECDGNTLEEIFARVYRAAQKTLDITPFDEQIAAALALAQGKMVQMQTGEGKTLCAVFAACAEALLTEGGGLTHILTFNDYLALRDYQWMMPVYDEMGVSVGCVTADTPKEKRGEIYKRSVVYATAKEAGFDYLRSFVLFDEKPYFPEELNYAIVDEADSILIDEARIPLVIAGDVAVRESGDMAEIYEKTAALGEGCFDIDEESQNAYLTDKGADKAEEIFGCDMYAVGNETLLAKICACLKARDILKEDKDYIVKDGSVVLIDELTGRAAPGRVFPGDLQAAVEAKHGLKISSRGRIMGSIALQYYARLYPKLAGMTGTAEQSREEFEKIYGILTQVILTRLPVARTDHPLELYYDKHEKRKAILAAIKEAAEAERPVLVGSESIEESESIAKDLAEMGIKCTVLNAKNDFEEADIIAKAGERGAVTISTNMAGRGVDIKLGGADGGDKDFVVSTGGLLVLATSPRESSRITMQLRGRAGRQGDVGESRAFAALDDPILLNNDLKGLSGRHYPSSGTEGALTDKVLLREAERVQRIAENNALDERIQLMKYTMIGEKHRDITFRRRNSLLDGSYSSEFWQKDAAELYEKAAEKFGDEELQELQNCVLAALLNEFWSDYLDYTTYLREGIHLTQIAGHNPAEEYNIACEEYYESAAESIPERMAEKLEDVLKCERLSDYELDKPTRTYTYLLNDIGEEFKAKPFLMSVAADNYASAAEAAFENASENEEEQTVRAEKKGLFGKLFGKKK